MLYIYFPVLYYHDNLYVTEGAYADGGVFRCPSGLSCIKIVSTKFETQDINIQIISTVKDSKVFFIIIGNAFKILLSQQIEKGTKNHFLIFSDSKSALQGP